MSDHCNLQTHSLLCDLTLSMITVHSLLQEIVLLHIICIYESFPVNYSLILHTAKVFHLEQSAMYGINFVICVGIMNCKQLKSKFSPIIIMVYT